MLIQRMILALVVGLCSISLSFHFVVESLAGIEHHANSGQAGVISDSHEEDQFVLSEPGNEYPAQTLTSLLFRFRLKLISHLLPPLLPPPKLA